MTCAATISTLSVPGVRLAADFADAARGGGSVDGAAVGGGEPHAVLPAITSASDHGNVLGPCFLLPRILEKLTLRPHAPSRKSRERRKRLLLRVGADHNPLAVQSARTFQIWSLLVVPMALAANCRPGLPSEVPLGGTESPIDAESSGGSSRAPDGARSAASDFEGEGGASDEAEAAGEEKEDDASEPLEITATPSAPVPGDKKKPEIPAAAPTAAAAPPCDDSNGTEPSCGELQSGACRSVFGPLCEQLGDALKPKVATAIVQCLIENNRRSRCESIEECLGRGLEQACVAPPDQQVCEKLFARCEAPTDGPWQSVAQCAKGVASLKKAVRVKVVECLDAGCDLEACFLKAGT